MATCNTPLALQPCISWTSRLTALPEASAHHGPGAALCFLCASPGQSSEARPASSVLRSQNLAPQEAQSRCLDNSKDGKKGAQEHGQFLSNGSSAYVCSPPTFTLSHELPLQEVARFLSQAEPKSPRCRLNEVRKFILENKTPRRPHSVPLHLCLKPAFP